MKNPILKEKIKQAIDILKDKQIDLWLTFVRESGTIKDPALDLILGTSVTWQSAFIITKNNGTFAIVGSLDKNNIELTGLYDDIRGYVDSIKKSLIDVIQAVNPGKIAINTSTNDIMSDGLTHGMHELLLSYLSGTAYEEKLISSEEIISALRGRKAQGELERIEKAVSITEEIFGSLDCFLQEGLTEKDVAAQIKKELTKRNLVSAWDPDYCPSVFTGPESAGAHSPPSDRIIKKGHIMNIDFGVKKDDYCSDLQRTWYFLKDGEEKAPNEVERAFNTVREAIENAARFIKPGVMGHEADNAARSHITGKGYEEYPHGLGHQVGRSTHDGAGLLCPRWERYGNLPYLKIEKGQVYTLEPRVTVPGYGVATIEEIIVVTEDGCRFLSHPQKELFIIK